MKRDLKINFGILEQIRDELYQFMRALENMKSSVNNIDNLLANASGKSIEAISQDKKGVITAIDTYKEQVNDVYVLISDYIGDMTSYIRPINQYGLMRVDRDDIWWNISQIEGANAVNVTKPSRYGYTPIAGYETDANNDLVAEQIEADIAYLKTRISGEISALWQIHDQQIAPFENTDDHFKSRSETLYDRYTSWEERNKDIMLGIETGIYNLFTGVIKGLVGVVGGFITLVAGVINYLKNGVTYLLTAPFGTTPEDVLASLDETNSLFASILKDPTLIIEGMAQDISDTFDEKGIMYSIGAVVPDIVVDILITKGLGKVGKLANFGDSIADVGKYADDIAKISKIEKFKNKLDMLRSKMPSSKLRNEGNMAVADVRIEGLPNEFLAHSKIHGPDSKGADLAQFSPTPENRLLESYTVDKFPRYNDTEAKILEDIASQIQDPNISGQIDLYTERATCQSCTNIILEFRRKYPNIKLNIFTE
ncbi:deaminase domain-containing protein [Listeria monocytogenes]|uniref:deaminase domain-containing protein n=1 Tax=Listeria monocytogenes TaxID=1639 RepID=UPI0010EE4910|nr:deaminase domain-containing protein [Listeria monocytogenes]EAD5120861.1 hypothetical protein [Listeria monocytogenes]EAG5891033.1 hypothetical protein [Listeria monocytogenes]ECW8282065.1 hypothetical protein [Listeria monocytogenes]